MRLALWLLPAGILLVGCATPTLRSGNESPRVAGSHVRIWAEAGNQTGLRRWISRDVEQLYRRVGSDFHHDPPILQVQLFSSHRSFSRALWREQQVRPQTKADNLANVVHNTLLIGPLPFSYLPHNLAHVYTEWVMDQVSGNVSDELPPNPWLYDGLAEYEAYRVAGAGPLCHVYLAPFDVTKIRTSRAWLAQRAGPMGPLEYCLAYQRVRDMVKSLGWHCVVDALNHPDIWTRGAALMARGRCPVS